MICLLFLIPPALVFAGMVISGDLRITRKQQQEWEARWAKCSPAELERISREYWR